METGVRGNIRDCRKACCSPLRKCRNDRQLEPWGGKTTSQTPKVLKCPSVPGDASSNATSRKALGRGIQPERCGEKTQHGSVNSRPNDQRSIEDGGCPRLTYGETSGPGPRKPAVCLLAEHFNRENGHCQRLFHACSQASHNRDQSESNRVELEDWCHAICSMKWPSRWMERGR